METLERVVDKRQGQGEMGKGNWARVQGQKAWDTELLKVEVVRSHGCPIFFENLGIFFLLLNAKQEIKHFF